MEPLDEKEFDPTIHTAEYVAIEPDETFAQIRDKIEDALKRTPNVILVIPRGAQAFHTTQDFLALGKIQWRREVRVAVATPDPTIAGLARVLGFHIVEPPADHPALAGDPALQGSNSEDADDSRVEKPTSPLPLGSLPGQPEWVISPPVPAAGFTPRISTSGNLTTSTWLNMPGDSMGAGAGAGAGAGIGAQQAAPPPRQTTRSGQPPPRTRPRQTGQLLPTQVPDLQGEEVNEADGLGRTPGEEPKARLAVIEGKAYRNGRGWRYNSATRSGRVGRAVLSVLLLLLLALGAASGYAYIYLPEGMVSVTPQSKTITDLPVEIILATGGAVSLPSGGAASLGEVVSAPSLIAGTIEKPLMEEGSAPATGSRQVARGRGQGTMHFVNTTAQAQLVPQGTLFKSANGIGVQTTQAGTVPATNFAAQQFGTLDIPIVATIEGPDGNLGAGKVQGVYNGVLNYFNYALQGGGLETIKVITQEDIDRLKAELNSRLEGRVEGIIREGVVSGQRLITETIRLEDRTEEISHKGGEDGDSVSVKVTGVARAYTYDEAQMADNMRQGVYDYIQAHEPVQYGPVTDPASITLSDAQLQPSGGPQGLLVYKALASARVKYTLTPLLAAQIRDVVKGQGIKEARALIAARFAGYVAVGDIKARVLWFNLEKLPGDPSRIEIQQGGGSE